MCQGEGKICVFGLFLLVGSQLIFLRERQPAVEIGINTLRGGLVLIDRGLIRAIIPCAERVDICIAARCRKSSYIQ